MKRNLTISLTVAILIIVLGGWYLLGRDATGKMRIAGKINKAIVGKKALAQQSNILPLPKATAKQPVREEILLNGQTPAGSQYVDITNTGGLKPEQALNLNAIANSPAHNVPLDNNAMELNESQLPTEVFIDGSKQPNYISFDGTQSPQDKALAQEALINAVSANDITGATNLLNNKVSPNMSDNATSTTPLFIAIANNNPDMTQILLENGAAVTQVNDKGFMPIHEAARASVYGDDANFKSNEIIDMLLQKGANVNQKNILGQTALMLATQNNRPDTVRFLIKNGADTTIMNTNGKNALDIAVDSQCAQCRDIIMEGDNRITEIQ